VERILRFVGGDRLCAGTDDQCSVSPDYLVGAKQEVLRHFDTHRTRHVGQSPTRTWRTIPNRTSSGRLNS
jgi:hypothetical protein